MNTHHPLAASGLACIALLAPPATHANEAADAPAPNATMRYVEVSAQRDAKHDQALMALLSLPVGERGWAQFGGGQARDEQDALARSPAVFSGAFGYIGNGWQASLSASQRSDGSRFRQTDWRSTLEWRGDRWDAGVDGSYRDARQAGTASQPTVLGGNSDVPVLQRVHGGGIGLHGDVPLTSSIGLSAAAMSYHYQVTTQQTGTGAGGIDSLLQRALQTSPSFVSRDESTLSRSVMVGANGRFEKVTVSGEFLADRVFGGSGTMYTTQLKAAIEVAPRWTVIPAVGRTRSSAYGDVGFAGLALNHAW